MTDPGDEAAREADGARRVGSTGAGVPARADAGRTGLRNARAALTAAKDGT